MPFAYFDRLTRRQQAIYLESDGIVTVPLPQAARLQPLVTALARALESGDRAHTESAAQRLVLGLAAALGAPPARVKVLAARPHAGWGELHGLYETTHRAAEPPLITLKSVLNSFTSSFWFGEPWGSWHGVHFPSFIGPCSTVQFFLRNPLWHSRQRSLPAFGRSFSLSPAWGEWQEAHAFSAFIGG